MAEAPKKYGTACTDLTMDDDGKMLKYLESILHPAVWALLKRRWVDINHRIKNQMSILFAMVKKFRKREGETLPNTAIVKTIKAALSKCVEQNRRTATPEELQGLELAVVLHYCGIHEPIEIELSVPEVRKGRGVVRKHKGEALVGSQVEELLDEGGRIGTITAVKYEVGTEGIMDSGLYMYRVEYESEVLEEEEEESDEEVEAESEEAAKVVSEEPAASSAGAADGGAEAEVRECLATLVDAVERMGGEGSSAGSATFDVVWYSQAELDKRLIEIKGVKTVRIRSPGCNAGAVDYCRQKTAMDAGTPVPPMRDRGDWPGTPGPRGVVHGTAPGKLVFRNTYTSQVCATRSDRNHLECVTQGQLVRAGVASCLAQPQAPLPRSGLASAVPPRHRLQPVRVREQDQVESQPQGWSRLLPHGERGPESQSHRRFPEQPHGAQKAREPRCAPPCWR